MIWQLFVRAVGDVTVIAVVILAIIGVSKLI